MNLNSFLAVYLHYPQEYFLHRNLFVREVFG